MDRYSLRGYKSHTHYVRALAGLHEEFVSPQIIAEIQAHALARTHPRSVVILTREHDDWVKVVRSGRPATGRGSFLVQDEFDRGNSNE